MYVTWVFSYSDVVFKVFKSANIWGLVFDYRYLP